MAYANPEKFIRCNVVAPPLSQLPIDIVTLSIRYLRPHIICIN